MNWTTSRKTAVGRNISASLGRRPPRLLEARSHRSLLRGRATLLSAATLIGCERIVARRDLFWRKLPRTTKMLQPTSTTATTAEDLKAKEHRLMSHMMLASTRLRSSPQTGSSPQVLPMRPLPRREPMRPNSAGLARERNEPKRRPVVNTMGALRSRCFPDDSAPDPTAHARRRRRPDARTAPTYSLVKGTKRRAQGHPTNRRDGAPVGPAGVAASMRMFRPGSARDLPDWPHT